MNESLNETSSEGKIEEGQDLSRRNFMKVIIAAVGGIVTAAMGVPAVAYVLGPVLRRQDSQEWIHLGATAKIELDTPTLFKVSVQRQTGWIQNEEEISAYLLTENGRDFVAMSNICSHLGCRVRWISDQGEFFCPCHNGVFDRQGNVVSGPPPRPLDRYQLKVEDDQIYILGG
jgi:menaquinol-cytochrome c reductase iron-sulfur subunit